MNRFPLLAVPLVIACLTGCAGPRMAGPPPAPMVDLEIAIVRVTAHDAIKAPPAHSRNILHTFRITTTMGVEASAEDVTLVSYPALFSTPPPGSTNEPPPEHPATATRQVGADITAMATMKDKHVVNVCVAATLVETSDVRTNRVTLIADGKSTELVAAQPVFRKLSLDTCVDVPFGQTVMAGKPMSGGPRGASYLIWVTAQRARKHE